MHTMHGRRAAYIIPRPSTRPFTHSFGGHCCYVKFIPSFLPSFIHSFILSFFHPSFLSLFLFLSFFLSYVLSFFQGNVRCVKFLLSKGADPLSKDENGSTALHLSTRHRSSRCLDLILNRLPPGGVDDQVRDRSLPRSLTLFPLFWPLVSGNGRGKVESDDVSPTDSS